MPYLNHEMNMNVYAFPPTHLSINKTIYRFLNGKCSRMLLTLPNCQIAWHSRFYKLSVETILFTFKKNNHVSTQGSSIYGSLSPKPLRPTCLCPDPADSGRFLSRHIQQSFPSHKDIIRNYLRISLKTFLYLITNRYKKTGASH